MKTHILVATDGSDTANKAIDLAAELAAAFEVPLSIGHVLQFGRPSQEFARMAQIEHIVESVQQAHQVDFNLLSGSGGGDLFAPSRPGSDTVRAITLVGDEILSRAATRATELGAKEVDTLTADDDPADGILDMADTAQADMIVLGHRGLGRIQTLLTGSVAQKVNNNATCTVVTVR